MTVPRPPRIDANQVPKEIFVKEGEKIELRIPYDGKNHFIFFLYQRKIEKLAHLSCVCVTHKNQTDKIGEEV